MDYIIDRFESDWAVISDKDKTFNIPKKLLPDNAKEGDVIKFNITIDKQATKKSLDEAQKELDDLIKNGE